MMNKAVVFPGQGSQCAGMGRDIADADKEVMEIWKKSESISGLPLREIYWDGDDTAMADTKNLQPALTVVNISLWMQAAKKVKASAFAGHSLGEFSAIAASNALSLTDVISAVTLRGELMAGADPKGNGAMAAVLKLPFEKVERLASEAAKDTGEMIIVANRNTPAQFVVSGTKTAVAFMAELVKEEKGRAVPLAVSGAFHSPLMGDAAAEFNKIIAKLAWGRPTAPIYCNVTGLPITDGLSLGDVMQKQMTSPVLWIDTVVNMWNNDIKSFVELGPKSVLAKMIPACLEGQIKQNDAPKEIPEEVPEKVVDICFAGTMEQLAAL